MVTVSLPGRIRNFAIIAHVDHGKSTLADRLLEATGTVPPRRMRKQFLDSMELEREKGITIKLKTVRMSYKLPERLRRDLNFESCILNLIDTPGHVDFSYEVSRSLAACEGVLLLVDASQGVQAQTVSNAYKAINLGLKIIPVISKIDLEHADPEGTTRELTAHFGFAREEFIFTSAKKNVGTGEVLEAIVRRIPAPSGRTDAPPRALIIDSFYDEYRGVIAVVRVVDGELRSLTAPRLSRSSFRQGRSVGESAGIPVALIKFMGTGAACEPLELGYFTPEMVPSPRLRTGEVGYIATGLKDLTQVRVGDTISVSPTSTFKVQIGEAVKPLPGYREPQSVVFANIFPVDKDEFPLLGEALGKLKLNDAALEYHSIFSPALGRGFELGLLGVLHLEIVRERLEREYGLDLVVGAPTVIYKVKAGDQKLKVKSAAELPEKFDEISEPWAKVEIITPYRYLGEVLRLIAGARGEFLDQEHLDERRLRVKCELPLAELITNFYDRLKSASSGFASLDWRLGVYRPVEAGKLEILVNKEVVEPFSRIVLKDKARSVGQVLAQKLKELLPQELFPVPIQVAFGGKIIARETIPALRKDVTAKLYGGDQTRKDKLLKKQKKGKKKLARIGKVSIPKEAFLEISTMRN